MNFSFWILKGHERESTPHNQSKWQLKNLLSLFSPRSTAAAFPRLTCSKCTKWKRGRLSRKTLSSSNTIEDVRCRKSKFKKHQPRHRWIRARLKRVFHRLENCCSSRRLPSCKEKTRLRHLHLRRPFMMLYPVKLRILLACQNAQASFHKQHKVRN